MIRGFHIGDVCQVKLLNLTFYFTRNILQTYLFGYKLVKIINIVYYFYLCLKEEKLDKS